MAAEDVLSGACQSDAAKQSSACQTTGEDPLTGTSGIIYKTARLISFAAGIVAVITVMVGGFMYITSGGDAGKAENGRKAVIAAAVGLAIIALAQPILAFVLNALN